jgi:hypothetical protein
LLLIFDALIFLVICLCVPVQSILGVVFCAVHIMMPLSVGFRVVELTGTNDLSGLCRSCYTF